jgi:hypothetical protein
LPPELVTNNKNTVVPKLEKEKGFSKFGHTKKESDDGYGSQAEEKEELRKNRQGWRTQWLWCLQAQGNTKREATTLRLSCHCLLMCPTLVLRQAFFAQLVRSMQCASWWIPWPGQGCGKVRRNGVFYVPQDFTGRSLRIINRVPPSLLLQ